tara:strand:+ start:14242 stop:15045 length:804 start_codon:yes stop_codon:yes gene_type:complete
MTELVYLIGNPAKHSLSPAIHNAGYKVLGLDFEYRIMETENLAEGITEFKKLGVKGFNITMPFKTEVIQYLDEVDEIAKKIGAINTVVNIDGKLIGYNTDGLGALESLKKVTSLEGKRVLLIGAGGAGKAIAVFLNEENVELTIANKPIESAQKLAELIGAKTIVIEEIDSLKEFDILINATPVGMEPNTDATAIPTELIHKELIVFDIVYEPMETKLLKEAKKNGCTTINGLEMLLNQGYAGFKLFTGREAPKNEMREAVMKELKK